jgi:hypothetical protein
MDLERGCDRENRVGSYPVIMLPRFQTFGKKKLDRNSSHEKLGVMMYDNAVVELGDARHAILCLDE